MANYYRQFSESIGELTVGEKQWLREALVSFWDLEGCPDDLEAWKGRFAFQELCDIEHWPGFEWWLSGSEFWIYSECFGDIECVAALVQRFFEEHRPDDDFLLTWADTCSKPEIGKFGGGWVYVTKDGAKYGDVWSEVDKCKEAK